MIVEQADLVLISAYRWRLRKSHSCYYAVRRDRSQGKERKIFMHRQITNAPPGLHVHHINGNTLDNRRSNLVVISPTSHHHLHAARRPALRCALAP